MKSTKDKIASSVKIGDKGQFVIPKEIRNMFQIKPGDTILLMADRERGIVIPPKEMFEELTKKIFINKESEENK